MARLMATFHAAGERAIKRGGLADVPSAPPASWSIYETFLQTPSMEAAPALLQFAYAMRRTVDMTGVAQAATKQWNECHGIVHGDARWENFLLTSGEAPGGGLNLRLIDWELVRRGDSLWDVSTVLAEYLRMWLTSVPPGIVGREEFEKTAAFPSERFRTAARAFVDDYAKRRRLDRGGRSRMLSSVAAYMPLNLLWIAVESSLGQAEMPYRGQVALELAGESRKDPEDVLEKWFGLQAGRA
jgi:thiamine kinase-like enzyme